MEFKIINSPSRIHALYSDKNVWEFGKDDTMPSDPNLFFPRYSGLLHVEVEPFGGFVLKKENDNTYEVHLLFNKKAIGAALFICREALTWSKEAIPDCDIITTKIPEYNHKALSLAKRIGMRPAGIEVDAFVKDGVKHDLHKFIMMR